MSFLLYVLIVAGQGGAPIDSRHPDAVEIFHCGFEEAADRDADAWPDGWTRRRGPNFPAYLPIKIAETPDAPEGQFALSVGLNGGAAAVFTPPINVGPLFSYVLEGYLKTDGLKNDRAFLSLTFYDAQGKQLETFQSEPHAAAWKKVRLGPLTAASEQVRTAVVGLHLEPSGNLPDLRGSAAFDDIWLARLPRMSLRTNRADNVYLLGAPIDIDCNVSGIFERAPMAHCELFDIDARPVGEPTVQQLENKTAASLAPRDQLRKREGAKADQHFVGSMRWRPNITQPGFYRARVTLEGSADKIVERQLTLAVVEPRRKTAHGEFGWTLPRGDAPLPYSVLLQLLPQMGLGWAKFPVWLSEKEVHKLDDLVDFAERLSTQGVESIGIIADPPADVRPQFGESTFTAAAIFSTEAELWYKSLEPVTTRLSLQVHWWQLGHDDDTSFVGDAQLAKRIAVVKKQLEQFGQSAHLGFAWRMLNETPRDKRAAWDFLSLRADPPLTPQELAGYLDGIEEGPQARWVVVEPLSRDSYSLKDRASDLVHRMVAAKRHGANGIFVPDPFDPLHGLMNADGTPGELLLPWRTTASMLSGAEFLGTITLPQGSNNYVFARDDEIIMVLWNSSPVEEKIFLGDGVRQVDLWGRGSKPPQEEQDSVFAVGPLPTFLVGVSEPIVRWNMDFAFDKLQLPSIFGRSHENGVRVKNFFPQGTAGQIRLHTPEAWQTYPRVLNFKLAANEKLHEPFTVRLPFDATNGRFPVKVDVDLTADRDYHFSIYRELQVGLDDIVIEMTSHLNAQGELEVEAFFSNKTDQLVSFKCSLYVPGGRRMVSQVTRLGTQRETKRYFFPNGRELIGKTIWLRADELGGERSFNYRFVVKE